MSSLVFFILGVIAKLKGKVVSETLNLFKIAVECVLVLALF